MTQEEKDKIQQKFLRDPDWIIIENMINEYLAPFKEIKNIDTKQSNDIIAAELRGRQLMVEQLEKFLREARILGRISNNGVNFK